MPTPDASAFTRMQKLKSIVGQSRTSNQKTITHSYQYVPKTSALLDFLPSFSNKSGTVIISSAAPVVDGTPSYDTLTLTQPVTNSVYVCRYNSSGRINWAARLSGTTGANDGGNSVYVDSNEFVYVTGYYTSASLTAYNANGTAFATSLSSSGSTDGFLVKYSPLGVVQWITRFGGSLSDIGNGVVADSAGNVTVVGRYTSSVFTAYNLDGSAFGTTLSNFSGTSQDCFIIQYNSNGTVKWLTNLGGSGNDINKSIALDSLGNLYLTGTNNSASFTAGNSDGTQIVTPVVAGGNDSFIIKYSNSGIFQWISALGGTGNDAGVSIFVDSAGFVYATGVYTSVTFTASNSDGSVFGTLANAGSSDVFLVKYNGSGNCQWITRLAGSAGSESPSGLSVDLAGNIYITGGYSNDQIVLYNSDGTTFKTFANSNSSDVFVAKYNSSGFALWGARMNGTNNSDTGSGISVDSTGNCYVTGHYYSTNLVVYNADESIYGTLTNINPADSFIVKYNTNGGVTWMVGLSGGSDDRGLSIYVSNNGNVYGTGYYGSNPLTLPSIGF